MNLLYNLVCTQPNSSGKRHGGGIYGEVIFRRIVDRGLPVDALYDSARWFNPVMRDFISDNRILLLDKRQEGSLKDIALKYGYEKIYCPIAKDEILDVDLDIDLVGTIHDARPLELTYDSMMFKYRSCSMYEKMVFIIKKYFPGFGYKHAYSIYKKALKNEHFRFAMVSNHSRHALLAYMPQFKSQDIQAYYSPSTSKGNITSCLYKEKYYLMVSANRWEKNCLRSIIAFDRLFSNGFLDNVKVRITGAKSQTIYKYKLRNPSRFEFMGYVSDDELEQLYHDAYAFIYPSLNEGFGYPPMEAMRYGVPCIVSPFTSIPEICQGAAIYTNPYSIEEIMNRILMMENQEIHDKYSRLSIEQEKKIRARQEKDLDGIIDFIYASPKKGK